MNRSVLLYLMAYVFAIIYATSCTHQPDPGICCSEMSSASLSVTEARGIFESDIAEIVSTRSTHTESPLLPGDFSPWWDKAATSSYGELASVDVPVIPTYRYRAFISRFRGGQSTAYDVPVWQKLIVVRRSSGQTTAEACYIMSIIPDDRYYRRHKEDLSMDILNCGDRGNFSGMIIYARISDGMPVRVNRYEKGVKVEGVFICDGDIKENAKKSEVFNSIMKNVRFARSRALNTRSGEDEWDYDGFYDLGGGIYAGDDGNIYYDTDGDGIPDSFWIDPVDRPDDPAPDPDPEPDYKDAGEDIGDGDQEPDNPTEGGGSGVDEGTDSQDPHGGTSISQSAYEQLFNKFNGNLSTNQWETLKHLLKKMEDQCNGNGLINQLINKLGNGDLSILYDPNKEFAEYDPNNNTLTMPNLHNGLDLSPSSIDLIQNAFDLFHELFHVYQYYVIGSSNWNTMRPEIEIEAKLASYYYLVYITRFDYEGANKVYSSDVNKIIIQMTGLLENNMNLIFFECQCLLDKYFSEAASMYAYDYGNYSYTPSNGAYMPNISVISSDC